eukprot:TRINITY_DN15925_c0_g1_i1.p1 TRINITY_DN15925_c0_g1~~TRINITY_DN15925_c0_g1_i1.p1  ORF type:complete len:58 (-),score=6.87 TRINITY_DN15925_c0_g1_i1:79-252(-)
MENLKDVFGESFTYRWILPTNLPQKFLMNFMLLFRQRRCVRKMVTEDGKKGIYSRVT